MLVFLIQTSVQYTLHPYSLFLSNDSNNNRHGVKFLIMQFPPVLCCFIFPRFKTCKKSDKRMDRKTYCTYIGTECQL